MIKDHRNYASIQALRTKSIINMPKSTNPSYNVQTLKLLMMQSSCKNATSIVDIKDDSRGRIVQKAKVGLETN